MFNYTGPRAACQLFLFRYFGAFELFMNFDFFTFLHWFVGLFVHDNFAGLSFRSLHTSLIFAAAGAGAVAAGAAALGSSLAQAAIPTDIIPANIAVANNFILFSLFFKHG